MIRLLLVESNVDDAGRTTELIRDSSLRADVVWATSLRGAEDAFREQAFDAAITELELADSSGLETISRLVELAQLVPVVALTSPNPHAEAEIVQCGAQDFLTKGETSAADVARAVLLAIERAKARAAYIEGEERLKLVLRATSDGVCDWDLRNGRIDFSERWYAILGTQPDNRYEKFTDWLSVVHRADRVKLQSSLHTFANSGTESGFEAEFRAVRSDGVVRWLVMRACAVTRGGSTARIVGALSDVTDSRVRDSLTGLFNRGLFEDRVGLHASKLAHNRSSQYAVIAIGLDRFAMINDAYGHRLGDEVLVESANRIQACLSLGDTLARFGGDEFMVLLSTDGVASARRVAEAILDKLSIPFPLGGDQVVVGASAGIALGSAFMQSPDAVVCAADAALNRAKADERGSIVVQEKNDEAVRSRLSLESNLRAALSKREFVVHYQPIINMMTGETLGVEALARWPLRDGSMISPAVFIPIAEEMGLIRELGIVILEASIRALADLVTVNPDVYVSVNVSAEQLRTENFSDEVLRILGDRPAKHLRLEITETVLLGAPERCAAHLERLRRHGILIALDDFGTGYSSLAYLSKLPIDVLKVDRSFVKDLDGGSADSARQIVNAIAGLARSLNFGVIAEGVETEAQRSVLLELGCDVAQGFLLARPCPLLEIVGAGLDDSAAGT